MSDTCKWTYDTDGYWEGECGIAWCLEDEDPKGNEMNFCPKCGKPLEQVEYIENVGEDGEDPL